MPQAMINNCTRMLERTGEVSKLPSGAGYSIDVTDFDITTFEKSLLRLHEQERLLIESLIAFVADRYKQIWTEDEAKKYLSKFLDDEGYGSKLFLREDVVIESRYISPSLYIGRYINHIQKQNDSLERKYLEEIINGMIIYQGVYQTNDYLQSKDQKFKGTTFYFDTKLVLRSLGYSWNAQVETTQELIRLITEKYGGKVGVFQQTIDEVGSALYRAGKARERGNTIQDNELRIYSSLNPVGADLMVEASTSVAEILKTKYGFEIAQQIDWDSAIARRNSIDVKSISEFIKNDQQWQSEAVTYDIEIVNRINIMRRGDYSERYGGKSRLPVFITSNSALVHSFRKYVTAQGETAGVWNPHALPIITDNMLLFRLWVPYATADSNLPALTLARYAYAAQNESSLFFETMRGLAQEYKSESGIDIFNISEIRRQKFEDVLINNASGDAEQLSVDLIATSVDEFVKMENISLQEDVVQLRSSLLEKTDEIADQEKQIIELAALPHVNKIGFGHCIIFLAKWWWIFAAFMLYFLTEFVSRKISVLSPIKYWAFLTPVIINTIILIVDKFVDDKALRNFLIRPAVSHVWKRYAQKVVKKTPPDAQKYRREILFYCLEHTKIFSHYKEYCVYR